MLDVTTLSPSGEDVNNEEAELPPLQDIINYSFYNVCNKIVEMHVVFASFLASQGPSETSSAWRGRYA